MLRITPKTEDAELYRVPDLVLDGYGVGDLVLTDLLAGANPGDFLCGNGLRTQVIICLMTDGQADPSELRTDDENRGWIGDSFDRMSGETAIGSKLWLLRRAAMSDDIETRAALYARMAMQTLIDQGAAARVDVTATADRAAGRLDLDVALYGRDGARTYSETFEFLWRQVDGLDRQVA